MKYSQVKLYIEQKLKGLNKNLSYHNAQHTLDDVLPAAERIANSLNVNNNELILLKTAVLFHDLGYLEQYENNESIGAHLVDECLPDYDYTVDQIKIVKQLILATQIPQNPSSKLEKIICDADLDSLWRDDFYALSMNLLKEINIFGQSIDLNDWLETQIKFLQSHQYFTEVSTQVREQGKHKNIAYLRSRIE